MSLRVILMRSEHPGNIGAVARSMANFGYTDLVLVSPQVNHLDEEALRRAKHAGKILKNAHVISSLQEAQCDWLIATSGLLGSDENIPRIPLTPTEIATRIAGMKGRTVGILFGPESSGLTNEEIASADAFISIPTHPSYPILNVSHAVAIILYTFFCATQEQQRKDIYTPISGKDKEILLGLVDKTLDGLDFPTPDKRETQKKVWHRFIGKSFLTRRESFALMGFFKKLLKKR